MTAKELQALTDQEFKFVAFDSDNNVKFAVPIPGVNAWNFKTEKEAQEFIWDDEEITACLNAWERYVKTLLNRKSRARKTEKFRVSMDADTKKRLITYAGEQRKSVSQLVTDWIWSQPSKKSAAGSQQ